MSLGRKRENTKNFIKKQRAKSKNPKNLKFIVCCYFGAEQKTSRHFKIVNGGGNFVRYAVAESAAYLAYVSIYDTSKVQNLPARTIFKKKMRTFGAHL